MYVKNYPVNKIAEQLGINEDDVQHEVNRLGVRKKLSRKELDKEWKNIETIIKYWEDRGCSINIQGDGYGEIMSNMKNGMPVDFKTSSDLYIREKANGLRGHQPRLRGRKK